MNQIVRDLRQLYTAVFCGMGALVARQTGEGLITLARLLDHLAPPARLERATRSLGNCCSIP